MANWIFQIFLEIIAIVIVMLTIGINRFQK